MSLSFFVKICSTSRALVAEALEISTFMEKMKSNNENDQLNELEMGDWAKYDQIIIAEMINILPWKPV